MDDTRKLILQRKRGWSAGKHKHQRLKYKKEDESVYILEFFSSLECQLFYISFKDHLK